MTTLTEEEFLKTKMKWFDYVCAYSYAPALLSVFVLVFMGLFGASLAGELLLAKIFVGLFLNTIVMRTIVGNKVTRWKEEYKKLL